MYFRYVLSIPLAMCESNSDVSRAVRDAIQFQLDQMMVKIDALWVHLAPSSRLILQSALGEYVSMLLRILLMDNVEL